MTSEAAYRLKSSRFARAATADDTVEIGAEMNALTREKAAVHGNRPHYRNAGGNVLLYADARIAVLQSQLQGIEAGTLHLITRDFAVAGSIATEFRESMGI
ncbi:MAG: hypothetical protein VX454_09700 [Pseudomonadota bacterium]|nr:hypothetical protein [Pseudomonadota bacterium]